MNVPYPALPAEDRKAHNTVDVIRDKIAVRCGYAAALPEVRACFVAEVAEALAGRCTGRNCHRSGSPVTVRSRQVSGGCTQAESSLAANVEEVVVAALVVGTKRFLMDPKQPLPAGGLRVHLSDSKPLWK